MANIVDAGYEPQPQGNGGPFANGKWKWYAIGIVGALAFILFMRGKSSSSQAQPAQGFGLDPSTQGMMQSQSDMLSQLLGQQPPPTTNPQAGFTPAGYGNYATSGNRSDLAWIDQNGNVIQQTWVGGKLQTNAQTGASGWQNLGQSPTGAFNDAINFWSPTGTYIVQGMDKTGNIWQNYFDNTKGIWSGWAQVNQWGQNAQFTPTSH